MADNVSDFLIKRINEWGIKRIYGVPGDGINGIIGAIGRAGDAVDYVQVRHEEMGGVHGLRACEVHRRGQHLSRHFRGFARSKKSSCALEMK